MADPEHGPREPVTAAPGAEGVSIRDPVPCATCGEPVLRRGWAP